MIRIVGPADPAVTALRHHLAALPNPVATVEIVPWQAYRLRVDETLRAAHPAFDAVCVPGHVWLPELADAGLLAELGAAAEPSAHGVAGGLQADGAYLGQSLALPLFTDGHLLVYRSDLLDPPGHAPDARNLLTLAQAGHLPPERYGIALKAHPAEIFLDWLPYYRTMGGELTATQGRFQIDEPAAVAALELYLAVARYAPPDTGSYGNEEVADALRTGRAAAAVTWGGQAAPIFASPPSGAGFAAVAPRHPWNVTWGIAVPARIPRSRRDEIAATLLALLSPELDQRVLEEAGSPVLEATYQQSAGSTQRYPWLGAQRVMLARAQPLPALPGLGNMLTIMTEALVATFRGEATAKSAIAAAIPRLPA